MPVFYFFLETWECMEFGIVVRTLQRFVKGAISWLMSLAHHR